MSLASFLGMGFGGYAVLNRRTIPILRTPVLENDNLIQSEGSFASDPALSGGQLPTRNRRSLTFTVSTIVCPVTIPLIAEFTYSWRNLVDIDRVLEIPFTVIAANGEGYEGRAQVDDVSLDAQPQALMSLDIQLTSWVWDDLTATQPTPKYGRSLAPLDDNYKPLPGWQTIPTVTAIGTNSIPLSWSLKFSNNWQYQPFLGGYLTAPNPEMIFPGPLDITLTMNWLAMRGDRPQERGNARLQIGNPAQTTINIPHLIRQPQRQLEGIGEGDEYLKWSSSFYSLGAVPFTS